MFIREKIAALLATFAVLACTGAMAEMAQVTGSAGYRERIALPEDAVLDVQLLDVSRMDVVATVLSAQRFKMEGVPQEFALSYDPALIDDRFTYSMRAELKVGDKILFRTVQSYPVLTRGAGTHADMMLVRAAAESPPLIGEWTLDELRGRMLISEERPTLNFVDNERVHLKGGCNIYNGAYETRGNELSFPGPIVGTMKACPEALENLDATLLGALSETAAYVQNGQMLALVNSAGVTVARFGRP